MRSIILGGLLWSLAFVSAAGGIDYGPQASLFVSYAFDAGTSNMAERQAAGLRYGFQLNNDWRTQSAPDQAPLLRWQFKRLHFDQLRIAGTPLLTHDMILRAEDGGGTMGYIKNHFGPIVLGIAGAVVLVATVDGLSNTGNRDVGDIDNPPGTNTRNCDGADRPPSCVGP